MKIVLTRSMLPVDIEYIKNGLEQKISGKYELLIPEEFTDKGIISLSKDAEVLLGPYVSKEILENSPNLKLIQVPWTGMDTFDFEAVRGYDVTVCNTHSNAESVAELGVTLVLDLLKKVSYHDRKMRVGNWNRDQEPLNLKSRMLSNQTVCILGYGNIGSRIGKLISAFGSTVIAVDDNAKEGASTVYNNDDIDMALAKADVVICTLPLLDSTKSLINIDKFKVMKKDAIFVNMSRAAIVDEKSVWEALNNGIIAGFASDVWWKAPKRGESESYPSEDYEFWKLENVIMSPHRAGFLEGCLPHLDGAISNLISLENEEALECIVDVIKKY